MKCSLAFYPIIKHVLVATTIIRDTFESNKMHCFNYFKEKNEVLIKQDCFCQNDAHTSRKYDC